MRYPANQQEAIRRKEEGEKVNFSTGIDGKITYGYGDLDEWGYWEFPLRFEFLSEEQQAVVRELDSEREN